MNNSFQGHQAYNYNLNDSNNYYYNNRNSLYRSDCPEKHNHKPLTFKSMKKNTISSLNDVEYFLNHVHHAFKCIKLYKLLK